MDLNLLQRETESWRDQNFPGWTEEEQIFGVVEEVGELAHHFLKRKQGIRGDEESHTEEVFDAIGDIIVYLTGVASKENVLMGDLVEAIWDKVRRRDWVSDPQLGGEA